MDKILANCRVLVVEDEMLVLMLIEDMLSDLGCTSIASAATVQKALALIEKQIFDFAMLDMNLNGQKSVPVADALAAHGVPFVFSTGNSVDDTWTGYVDRPVIRKPFLYSQLVAILSGLIPAERRQGFIVQKLVTPILQKPGVS